MALLEALAGGPPPALSTAFYGMLIAALTAVTAIVSAIGVVGAQYIRDLSEDKRRARLRQAGVEAAAIVEEASRLHPMHGEAKADLAAVKVRQLEPRLSAALGADQMRDVVSRGVATLRGSLPHPSVAVASTSVTPAPASVRSPSRLPPPPNLPTVEERVTPVERPGRGTR